MEEPKRKRGRPRKPKMEEANKTEQNILEVKQNA